MAISTSSGGRVRQDSTGRRWRSIDEEEADGSITPTFSIIDESRLSTQRRRFLIFVGFDFGLTVLLWIILTAAQTKPNNWEDAFRRQVDVRSPKFFQTSLFDLCVLALFRLVWLVVFFGVCRVNTWLPVAFSTGATTIFLVAKTLYYFTGRGASINDSIDIGLVICSFITCWVELYLMPFSVLRREERRREETDRGLLVNQSQSGHLSRISGHIVSDREDIYGTAEEFSSGSSEEGSASDATRRRQKLRKPDGIVYKPYSNSDYVNASMQAMVQAREWLTSVNSWKIDNKSPLISSCHDKSFGKVLYLKTELSVSATKLYQIMYHELDQSPRWNRNVSDIRCIMRVNESTDITYAVTAPALKGYISPRDFLDVRFTETVRQRDASGDTEHLEYFIAGVSVHSTILPPQRHSKLVRGQNGPNLVVLRPSATDPKTRTTFEWIVNTNLKGDIPKRIVERNMLSFLLGYTKNLKTHLEKLEKKGFVQ